MFAVGRSTISLPFFRKLTAWAPLHRNASHKDIRSQYACANNMLVQLLYESSSTSSTSTSEEEDSRRVEPSLRRGRGEPERALDLVGKEEDRGSPVSIPSTWSICDSHECSRLSASAKAGPAPRGTSQVKLSHVYLYRALNNTNCNKATTKYQNRKIVSIM